MVGRAPRDLLFPTAVVVLISAFGCGYQNVKTRNDIGLANLANRAEFDLNCPRTQLRVAPLQSHNDLVTSYAVIGCGKRAVYMREAHNTFRFDPDPSHMPQALGSYDASGAAPQSAPPSASPPSSR